MTHKQRQNKISHLKNKLEKNRIETLIQKGIVEQFITSLESVHDSIQVENEEHFDTPQWKKVNQLIDQTQTAVNELMRVE